MEKLAYALSVLLPFVYAGAAAAYLRLFIREAAPFSRAARAGLLAALALSTALVVIRAVGERHVPLSNSGEAFDFFTLCTLTVYAYLELRMGTQKMGVFILFVLFVFQSAASLQFEPFSPIRPDLESG
ncbi:MAG: hypothetical protein IH969_10760, partial [Candidatus Krumholzibacteriota bacterium]|nr:hypothetical protein [Candidatus Krumholzibacteriota bacterium]